MNEITMRRICQKCSGTFGRIETKNGQDCVYCCQCGRHCYNAPKTETGRAARTVTTIHNGIKPNQRMRVLQRATARCEICGKAGAGVNLHVGHLMSVKAGIVAGLTEAELNDDENLAAMCEECNSGLGDEPVTLRFVIARLLSARVAMRKRETTDAI